ncbi:putative glutathione peroxidase 8 isoform X2 [Capsicum chacoense]
MASQSEKKPQSVYDFAVMDAMGKDVDLSIYKGKVLIIVNVASKWERINLCPEDNHEFITFLFLVIRVTHSVVLVIFFLIELLTIICFVVYSGMTNSNYTELNQLYEKYKNKGLEILAFPCNQFGEEEPGTNDQILDFVCTHFKSEFPIFDKIEVNGENASPLYKFLKSGNWGIFSDDIQWNFAKFLVDKNGQVVDRYYPTTSSLTIERDMKKLLEII